MGISRLKLQKVPGPDGYPALFYKTFCMELAPVLTHLFNEIRRTGEMPPTMQLASVTVLPKPGKDPHQMFLLQANFSIERRC